MFTGVALNIENSFVVGERVKIGDVEGTIVQTTWRSTTVLTGARRLVSIPNAVLGTASIVNFDRPDKSESRTLEICLDYNVTIQSAERILLAGVLGAVGAQIVDAPSVFATRLDKDGVVHKICYVIADHGAGMSADHAVIRSVLTRLRDAGLGVAYPKQEVVSADRRIRVADRVFDRRVLVEQCALFHGLSPDVCTDIATVLVELEVRAGLPLLTAGENRPSLFIVGEGLIRRMRARLDRPELFEERFVATQAFGQRALVGNLPHAATISALTHSLVFELTRTALGAVLAEHPQAKGPLATNQARLPLLDAASAGEARPWSEADGHSSAFYLVLLEAIEAEHRRTCAVEFAASDREGQIGRDGRVREVVASLS